MTVETGMMPSRDSQLEVLKREIDELRNRLATEAGLRRRFDADILDNLSLGFIALDPEWRYVYVNTAAERLYGRSRADIIGRNFWTEHSFLVGSEIEYRYRSTQEGGRCEDFEYEVGGRWWDLRTSPDNAGGILVYFQDITERKRAESALKHAEARYRAITEQSPFSTQVFDLNGETIRVNPAWEKLWGVTSQELGGYNILRDEQLAERGVLPFIERAFRGEVVSVPEIPYSPNRGRRAGRQVWVKAFLYPVRDDSGRITEVVLIHEDVTSRRISEQRLNEVNAQLNAIVKNSPVPIVALTAAGNIMVWNPAAERLFGWTEEEVLGRPLPFIPEEKLEEHRAMRARDLTGQGFSGYEVRRRRKDGSPVDLSVSTAPLRDEDGSITGIMSLYVDITEQRQVRAALEHSERTYRFLSESIPAMVWTASPDGQVDYLNDRGAEYLGVSREAVFGSGWLNTVHPEDRDASQRRWTDSLRSGEVFENSFRLRRADGEYHWHLARAVPFRDSENRVLRWFGTCTDIEAQKRTEAELRRANEDLNRFAYSASHDLQEPLRMIASFAQLFARKYEGQLDGAADQYIEYVVDGVRRMHALIDGLLTYTRIANVTAESSEISDANEALQGALSNLADSIRSSGARVTSGPLPAVHMRSIHLVQLFQNLIGNAIKYRSEGPPRIDIQACRTGSQWQFSIADNGIGIDQQYTSQVFGMFKRLHPNFRYEGTGIGLAICYRIVQLYGGQIWVESEGPGQGSCFRFTLPAA